jgi:dTDP-4-amino-4,6-dideoxygalactose transaminase
MIQRSRQRIWNFYREHLQEWAASRGVGLPYVPPHCEQPYHMFYLVMPSLEQRQALIAQLRARGILAVFHYQPLHLSEMGRAYGGREGDCPVTEEMADRIVRLPFFNAMTDDEQLAVVEAILRSGGAAG